MPRISINEMTTYHWSFDEDLTHYEAVGVGGVGVWRRKLNEFGDERGIEMLRDSRLKVSSLACAGGFTGSDGHTFREAVDDALDALRLAAEMQADCLIVVTGARAGHTLNHARRLAAEALKVLGDAGAALGVQVAVQPVHRQPAGCWTFLTTLEETLELLGRCNHPHVGMVFDVVQFWHEASTIGVSQMIPNVKIAGLSDIRSSGRARDNSRSAGGEAPLSEMIRRMEESGYRGWYDLKILCEQCWMSDYPRLIADCCRSLRGVCPQLFGEGDETTVPPFAAPPSGEGATALRFTSEPAPPV